MAQNLYDTVDNFDETGKPAGCLGFAGALKVHNPYGRLMGLAMESLGRTMKKFEKGYLVDYQELPDPAKMEPVLVAALRESLAEYRKSR